MKVLTKVLGTSLGMAAAIALSASTAQAQNLLVNGSFETSPAGFTANPITPAGINQGWATFGAGQNNMFNAPPQDNPYDGSYALLAVNGPGNNWNPQGAYQIISGVNAGATYTLSAEFLTDTGTQYATPVALQIGFGNFVSGVWTIVGSSTTWGFGDNGSTHGAIPTLNQWYNGSVSAVAPAGAADAVVYLFAMDNGQTATEDVYFDATTLTVPEPTTLALLGMGLAVPFFFRRK